MSTGMTAHLHDVLRMCADGLTDAQIAAKMGIRSGTVRGCMQRVCHAYGAVNRAHAVALAMRLGDLR